MADNHMADKGRRTFLATAGASAIALALAPLNAIKAAVPRRAKQHNAIVSVDVAGGVNGRFTIMVMDHKTKESYSWSANDLSIETMENINYNLERGNLDMVRAQPIEFKVSGNVSER